MRSNLFQKWLDEFLEPIAEYKREIEDVEEYFLGIKEFDEDQECIEVNGGEDFDAVEDIEYPLRRWDDE